MTLLVIAAFGVLAVGCGRSGSTPVGSTSRSSRSSGSEAHSATDSDSAQRRGAKGKAEDVGASPSRHPSFAAAHQVEILREQFPKPKPSKAKDSAKVIAEGEKACAEKTPDEVREEFFSQSSLEPDQVKMADELPWYETLADKDPSFVAGQIAATVYEMTLPKELQPSGFQGCVYALTRELEKGLTDS